LSVESWNRSSAVPRQDELARALDADVAPRIAARLAVPLGEPRLFLAVDEAPNLVRLHVIDLDVPQRPGQEPLARLPGLNENGQDRVAVNAGEPFGGANGRAFQEHPQAHDRLVVGKLTPVGRARGRIGERLPALVAAVSLGTVPVPAEPARGPGAVGAIHGSRLFALGRLG
jgi:hypothetical protein